MFKYFFSVLSLGEEETGQRLTYLDAEEEVYGSEIFHRELKAKLVDDALQKVCGRGSQYNIVDV